MKLAAIFHSTKAWQALSALKKNPKLAYRLFKYEQKIQREIAVCEKQRDVLIYACAGVEPPTPPDVMVVQIQPGTPQMLGFVAKFNEFLEGESDLAWTGIPMEELIEALGAEAGNALAEDHIALLEPFFTAPEVSAAA